VDSGRRSATIALLAAAPAVLFVAATLVSRIEITCNDDAYVYFNYARNLAAGNGLAYDPRGVASEGFSSLAYLLLLVPFEAAGVEPMFAATVIGTASLFACLALLAAALLREGVFERGDLPLFAVCALAILSRDRNVAIVLGFGLETLLSPAAVLAFVLCAVGGETALTAARIRAWSVGLAFAGFAAMLVRPEHALLVAALFAIALLRSQRKAAVARALAGTLALSALWLGWKLVVFGDVFPTAFYRKMHPTGTLPGLTYVAAALRECAPCLVATVVASVAAARVGRGSPRRSTLVVPMLFVAATVPLVIGLWTIPLVGSGFRFLVDTYVLVELSLAAALAVLVRGLAARLGPAHWGQSVLRAAAILLAAASSVVGTRQPGPQLSRLDLAERARASTREHPYLRFGTYLRRRLVRPERLGLVFGDAGCIPYASHCRFLDANGLAEPPIARLFWEKDPAQRARRFVDLVRDFAPDLVVLAHGPARDGWLDAPFSMHSPFWDGARREVGIGYKEMGIGYVCSVRAFYDVHVGVRQDSALCPQLLPLLARYCASNGYTLPGGLGMRYPDGSVHFEAASCAPQ